MRPILTPPVLRPTARPQDIYTRTDGGAKLRQLADGLSQFAPSLSRFGGALQEGVDKDAETAGANAARDFVESGKTYKDAITAGLIKPHQSPYFRLGAYETFGRASAVRYSDDVEIAFAKSKVAQSTNPADFDKFEGDFRGTWTKEHLGDTVDPYFANAFGKQADTLMDGKRHNFAEQAGARLVQQTGEAFHAEAYGIIENSRTFGLDDKGTLGLLNQAAERQTAAGMDRSIVNQLLSSAIDAAAVAANNGEGDAEILKLKKQIKLGAGTLAGTSYGSKGTEDTANKITIVQQRKLVAEEAQKTATRKANLEALTSDAVAALQASKSPLTVDMNPYIDRARAMGEGDKATTLLNIQSAFADRTYKDIPEVEQRLYIGVHEGTTTMEHLDEALAARTITFPTYSKLSDDIKERDKQGQAGAATKQAEIERVRGRFKSLFVAEYGGSTAEQRYRAEQASSEGVAKYLRTMSAPEGQKMTSVQKEEWIHNEVMHQFGVKADVMDKNPILAKRIPDADFSAPSLVNPKKAPAVPPETFQLIKTGYARLQAGGKLLPAEIAALKAVHVAPKDIEEWITLQQKHNP